MAVLEYLKEENKVVVENAPPTCARYVFYKKLPQDPEFTQFQDSSANYASTFGMDEETEIYSMFSCPPPPENMEATNTITI